MLPLTSGVWGSCSVANLAYSLCGVWSCSEWDFQVSEVPLVAEAGRAYLPSILELRDDKRKVPPPSNTHAPH